MSALADEMLTEHQTRQRPTSNDPAFAPAADERWRQIEAAHTAIGPMYWSERIALQDSCEVIRAWIATEVEG